MKSNAVQDGNIASASEHATIKLWNVIDGSVIKTLTEHTSYILSLMVNYYKMVQVPIKQ